MRAHIESLVTLLRCAVAYQLEVGCSSGVIYANAIGKEVAATEGQSKELDLGYCCKEFLGYGICLITPGATQVRPVCRTKLELQCNCAPRTSCGELVEASGSEYRSRHGSVRPPKVVLVDAFSYTRVGEHGCGLGKIRLKEQSHGSRAQ